MDGGLKQIEIKRTTTAADICCMDGGGLMQIKRPQMLSRVHYKPIRAGARKVAVSCS